MFTCVSHVVHVLCCANVLNVLFLGVVGVMSCACLCVLSCASVCLTCLWKYYRVLSMFVLCCVYDHSYVVQCVCLMCLRVPYVVAYVCYDVFLCVS